MNWIQISAIAERLNIDLADGLQVIGAKQLAQQYHPQIEPTLPLLVGNFEEISKDATSSEKQVAFTLRNCYPMTHEAILFQFESDQAIVQVSSNLSELTAIERASGQDYLYIPPLAEGGSFTALLDIVAHLRAPDGCPWDREQTLTSLRHDLLDEAAEVLEAIDVEVDGHDNTTNIVEELGDLLLLPAMMTQIAVEDNRFQMADVTRGIVEKLIRRHPHVFGNITTDNVDEIVVNWDAIKAQEKAEKGEKPRGPLDGVPASLPALEKARKLQSKAEKSGILERRELAESTDKMWTKIASSLGTETLTEQELGTFLWGLVAVAHLNGLNAENALRSYLIHFRKRTA